MQLQKIIQEISELAKMWHSNNGDDDSEEDFDARLLIAQYILNRGYDVNVGEYKASRLIEVFLNQEVGQNEEAYCGFEEEMLSNFIQMFANPENTLGFLTNDDPIEGIYKRIINVNTDIYMVINYYESLFWPEDISFQYDLENFNVIV